MTTKPDKRPAAATEPAKRHRSAPARSTPMTAPASGRRSGEDRAGDGLGEAPLLALGGGLALGAVLAALLPGPSAEDRLLGQVGGKITGGARAAADAAKEAGREKLSELNITRDAGASAMQSLIQGDRRSGEKLGQAALGAVRKKD